MFQKFPNDLTASRIEDELAKGAGVPHVNSGKLESPIMRILESLIDRGKS